MAEKDVLKYFLEKQIVWKPNAKPLFPHKASADGKELLLRINDFPEESLYTLFVDGQPVGDLDDFPESWSKS